MAFIQHYHNPKEREDTYRKLISKPQIQNNFAAFEKYVSLSQRLNQEPPRKKSKELENLLLLFAAQELNSSTVAHDDEEASESFWCIWPFVLFFRICGLCPLFRCRSHLLAHSRRFSPLFLTVILGRAIQLLSLTNYILRLVYDFNAGLESEEAAADSMTEGPAEYEDETTTWNPDAATGLDDEVVDGLVSAANYYSHYGTVFSNSFFIIWKYGQFPLFLAACRKIEILLKKFQPERNGKLVIKCWILCIVFQITKIIGAAIYAWDIAIQGNFGDGEGKTELTTCSYFEAWNNGFVPTNSTFGCSVGIGIFVTEAFCEMGSNYAETLLSILCLILTQFFVRFNKKLGSGKGVQLSAARLHGLCDCHKQICQLVQFCNEIFSPLFAVVYLLNVGNLFTRLYLFLHENREEDHDWLKEMESIYSFCYLIFIKTLIPSYLAASLHEEAEAGLLVIHNFPSGKEKGTETGSTLVMIRRLTHHFKVSRVGISGCRYFFIDKSFIVTLLGALLTYGAIVYNFRQLARNARRHSESLGCLC